MKHVVYVLESETNGRLYVGVSSDLSKRIQYHNAGRVQSTKYYRPYRLVGFKAFASFLEARRAELSLKRFKNPSRVRNWVLA